MRYEIFVINIIIEPKNVWENPITYSGINRWHSNKVRCKKKYPNTRVMSPGLLINISIIILLDLNHKEMVHFLLKKEKKNEMTLKKSTFP